MEMIQLQVILLTRTEALLPMEPGLNTLMNFLIISAMLPDLISALLTGKENFKFQRQHGQWPLNVNNFKGSDFGLFVQTEIHPFEWTRLEAGLRYDQHIAPLISCKIKLVQD